MKKKRIILILLTLLVLGGVGAGIFWLYRRSTGTRLLARASLKIEAGQLEDALELAETFTAKYPGDWRGYYYQAQATLRMARYDEARASLNKVLDANMAADVVACRLLLADTYGQPARQTDVQIRLDRADLAKIKQAEKDNQQAVAELEKLLKHVGTIEDEQARLEAELKTKEPLGRYYLALGRTRWALADRLRTEAPRKFGAGEKMEASRLHEEADKLDPRPEKAAAAALVAHLEAEIDRLDKAGAQDKAGPLRAVVSGLTPDPATQVFKGSIGICLAREIKRLDGSGEKAKAAEVKKIKDRLAHDRNSPPAGSWPAAHDKGIAALKDIVVRDPSRERPARMLIDACVRPKDRAVLEAIYKVMLSAEEPAPISASRLIRRRVRDRRYDPDKKARAEALKGIKAAVADIDKLLVKHADVAEVKLDRAELAILLYEVDQAPPGATFEEDQKERQKHAEAAKKHIEDVLRNQANHVRARLLQAQLLSKTGQIYEAERALFNLQSDLPKDSRAAYEYARAARRAGRSQQAYEALRAIVENEEKRPPRQQNRAIILAARGLMAEHLLKTSPADAFADANASYTARPNQPEAIRLFVLAAKASNREVLARRMLEEKKAYRRDENRPGQPERAVILMAAAQGYVDLSDKKKKTDRENQELLKAALEVAAEASKLECETAEGLRCKAKAVQWTTRSTTTKRNLESENLLLEARKVDPSNAEVCYDLGVYYGITRRPLQAREMLQTAYRMSPQTRKYATALARALMDLGELGDADLVLQKADPTERDNEVKDLRIRIAYLRGEPVRQEMTTLGRGAEYDDLREAFRQLGVGNTNVCVEICLKLLKQDPTSRSARRLLGRAYLSQGKKKECIRQWRTVLESEPGHSALYRELAAVMGSQVDPNRPDANSTGGSMKLPDPSDPNEVKEELMAIRGAREDYALMARAWLRSTRRQYDQAAKEYGEVVDNEDFKDPIRAMARKDRAECLVRAGKFTEAMADLDELAGHKYLGPDAQLTKVMLLAAMQKADAAKAILQRFRDEARSTRDTKYLLRVFETYYGMKDHDNALATCEEFLAIEPGDPRPHLLMALMLRRSGRLKECAKSYRKAVQLQPQAIGAWAALVRVHDQMLQPKEALKALADCEKLSRTARENMLFERGVMFYRWGLYRKAVEQFAKLDEAVQGKMPHIQYRLGQAFVMLGERERAIEVLGRIPSHHGMYVPARHLLANLAEGADARLAALDQLEKEYPEAAEAPSQRILILMDANRVDEAAEFVRQRRAKMPKGAAMQPRLALTSLNAVVRAGDRKTGFEIAKETAGWSRNISWRVAAVLLSWEDQPDVAESLMLPPEAAAHPYETLLGICLAVRKKDAAAGKAWMEKLTEFDRKLVQMGRPPTPRQYTILAALALGDVAKAKVELASYKQRGIISPKTVGKAAGYPTGKPVSPEVAADLILATMAGELILPPLGQRPLAPLSWDWAMKVLKDRNTCQWAAALAMTARGEPKSVGKVRKILKPDNSLFSLWARASLLRAEGKYVEAAEAFGAIARRDERNYNFVVEQAVTYEQDGKLPEAVKLYKQVWDAKQEPRAGNNAAYLMAQLNPTDRATLGQALLIAEEVVKLQPSSPNYRDTKGWILHLVGRNVEARRELRMAVLGMAGSVEIQHHVGVVEKELGNLELAGWHLGAACDLAKLRQERGGKLTVSETKALESARKELDALQKAGAKAAS